MGDVRRRHKIRTRNRRLCIAWHQCARYILVPFSKLRQTFHLSLKSEQYTYRVCTSAITTEPELNDSALRYTISVTRPKPPDPVPCHSSPQPHHNPEANNNKQMKTNRLINTWKLPDASLILPPFNVNPMGPQQCASAPVGVEAAPTSPQAASATHERIECVDDRCRRCSQHTQAVIYLVQKSRSRRARCVVLSQRDAHKRLVAHSYA